MNGLMDAKCVKYDRLDLFPEIVYNECCKDSVKSEPSQNVYCIVGLGRSQIPRSKGLGYFYALIPPLPHAII